MRRWCLFCEEECRRYEEAMWKLLMLQSCQADMKQWLPVCSHLTWQMLVRREYRVTQSRTCFCGRTFLMELWALKKWNPFSNEDLRWYNLIQESNSPRNFLSSVFLPFSSLSSDKVPPHLFCGSEFSVQWERWQQAVPVKQFSNLELPFEGGTARSWVSARTPGRKCGLTLCDLPLHQSSLPALWTSKSG